MMDCKQRKGENPTGFFVVLKRGAFFAWLMVCMCLLAACAKGDKYVEIVIASSDVVITPVPKAEAAARAELQAAGSLPQETLPPQEQPREQVKTIEANAIPSPLFTPQPTATPALLPTATPALLPTATPALLPTVTPTIKPTPTPAATLLPTPTAAPSAAPTPEPAQPDAERQLRQELDAAYLEYEAQWWKAYEKFSERCLPILDTIDLMGEPTDDPEYHAMMASFQAELDELQAEYEAEIAAIEAASLAKQEAIYAKYGK